MICPKKEWVLVVIILFSLMLNSVFVLADTVNQLNYDPDILQEFEKKPEIPIIIKIYDTTGITISHADTSEIQLMKKMKKEKNNLRTKLKLYFQHCLNKNSNLKVDF